MIALLLDYLGTLAEVLGFIGIVVGVWWLHARLPYPLNRHKRRGRW